MMERDEAGPVLLHVAVQLKRSSTAIEHMVKKCPGSVRVVDNNGDLPLHVAARVGANVTIVQTLAKKYRKSEEIKNRKGEIALHLAGYGGNFDVIKYLVQRWDFSVHQATYSGKYPLHFALQGDLPLEAIVFLGQLYSAAIRIRTVNGRLPLQYAVSREAVPDPNVVKYLVRMCVDSVKQKDNTGNLPLHLLVAHKYLGVEEVQVLVDAWKDSVLEPGPSGM
jgi:Ankyrin repeats (many copies)